MLNPDYEDGFWQVFLEGKVGHIVDFDEDKNGQLKVGVKWQDGRPRAHYLDELLIV